MRNFINWKINKFREFYNLKKKNKLSEFFQFGILSSFKKIRKFWNRLSIRYSALLEMGGDQNLERRNVERPVFRNFEIANIKIRKDELLDNFIFEHFFSFF